MAFLLARGPVVLRPSPSRRTDDASFDIIGPSPSAVERYRVAMATEKEILQINGHEVTVSNPRKVYFPETGHTKLDLVRYYQAVAEGALRGAGGRPMALKRFVDGAAGQPFFQKRAPENIPAFIRTATLAFPSGRTADEIVIDDAAGLAWVNNLGCIDLNPHPVRADDLDHPDELRVDLDPVPGVEWPQIREVALACHEALEAVGLVGWPKTSGSRGIHINVRIEPRWTFPEVRRAALALARDVERRVPHAATSKWWKEERHGVFLDYNQNAKDRTVASAYSVRPLPDARVSTPLTWDEVPTVEAEAFTIDTVPARFASIGDPGAGIDEAVGSLEALLGLSARDEAEGLGDAPWPPNYAKQAGEPPRVQPSKARRPKGEYEPGRGEAGGPPPEVAAERAAAVAAGDTNAGLPTEWVGSKPTPTGRRKSAIPVVEISRAEFKDDALKGLELWKARHPEGVGHLQPADILVDGMRGRSAVWYRVRVNLIHVPEADRPAQEALESDFDPWAGQDIEAWKAATAGARARKPTPKPKSKSKTEPT
jgi:bifunctional non-homologous end joining protein LigD